MLQRICDCGGYVQEHDEEAATEAAAREREQEREERQVRLKELWKRGIAPCVGTVCEDAINFGFAGRRYEIREVAAHREE